MQNSLIQKFVNYSKIKLAAYFIFSGVALFFAFQGHRLGMDAPMYIQRQPNVGGFYPFLLWLVSLTGWSFYLNIVALLQLIALSASTFIFLNTLQKSFKIKEVTYLVLSLVFIYPVLRYGNLIQTEAFAFSFFLLFVTSVVEILYLHKRRHMGIVLFWYFFLVFTRAQFLALFPVLWLILTFAWLTKRIRFRYLVGSLIGSLFVLYMVSMSVGFYHFKFHRYYTFTPFSSLASLCNSLYVSKSTDSITFKYETDLLSYNRIQEKIRERKLTYESYFDSNSVEGRKPNLDQMQWHYQTSYSYILHEVEREVANNSEDNSLNSIAPWIKMDQMARQATWQIINLNREDYLRLYSNKMIRTGFRGYVFMFVFGIIFIFSLIQFRKPKMLFIAVTCLFHLSNLLLIDFGAMIEQRYTFYTELVYFAALLLLLFDSQEKQSIGKV